MHFETKLLRQVRGLDDEVPFCKVVNALAFVVKESDLLRRCHDFSVLRATSLLMKHQISRQLWVQLLTFEVSGLLVHLTARQLRIASLGGQASVSIDRRKRALHQLATLQDVVDCITEDRLSVHVALDLKQELPTGHTVSDLERKESILVGELGVKCEHERLLLQAFVLLKLEVGDVHVLLPRLVLDREAHRRQ